MPPSRPGWLDEGAFASLVDYDSYWSREALAQAAKFCTDDIPQLKLYQSMGYFQNIPPIHADLGRVGHRQEEGPRKRQGAHHDRQPGAGHRRHGGGAR